LEADFAFFVEESFPFAMPSEFFEESVAYRYVHSTANSLYFWNFWETDKYAEELVN